MSTKSTYGEFFADVIRGLKQPVRNPPLRALAVVSIVEGSNDYWNPLNSVIAVPGSSKFNAAGVQRYPDFATGVKGTLALLSAPRWKWAVQAMAVATGRELILRQFEVEYATWGSHPNFYAPSTSAAVKRLNTVMSA